MVVGDGLKVSVSWPIWNNARRIRTEPPDPHVE
jgi:hypothetical protein